MALAYTVFMDTYTRASAFYQKANTEKHIYGKSLFGRELYAVKIGSGRPLGIATYGLHAREYITAEIAFLQYAVGVKTGSLWLLPLTNPDGALLSQTGITSAPKERRAELIALNGERGEDFSLWKANGRGVDLNVNFPARWGTGAKNVRFAGGENYIGAKPFSEPENLALKQFTEKIRPQYTLSYHTKGEEIYWRFHQPKERCVRDKALAAALSRATGYPLAEAGRSAGGYKDWCIQRFKIPSFTVEVGSDLWAHPLGDEALQEIIERNENALAVLSAAYEKTER